MYIILSRYCITSFQFPKFYYIDFRSNDHISNVVQCTQRADTTNRVIKLVRIWSNGSGNGTTDGNVSPLHMENLWIKCRWNNGSKLRQRVAKFHLLTFRAPTSIYIYVYPNLRQFIIIAKLASNYRRRTLEFHRCFPPFRPVIIKWLALSPSNVWYDVYICNTYEGKEY